MQNQSEPNLCSKRWQGECSRGTVSMGVLGAFRGTLNIEGSVRDIMALRMGSWVLSERHICWLGGTFVGKEAHQFVGRCS